MNAQAFSFDVVLEEHIISINTDHFIKSMVAPMLHCSSRCSGNIIYNRLQILVELGVSTSPSDISMNDIKKSSIFSKGQLIFSMEQNF